MNQDITKLMSHVYELEGLLLVLDKHGAETPAVVLDMIREKGALIAQECALVQLPEPVEQPAPSFNDDIAESEEVKQQPDEEEKVVESETPAEPELPAVEPEPAVTSEPVVDEELEIEVEHPAPFVHVTDDSLDDDMPTRDDDDAPLNTFGDDFNYVEPEHRSAQTEPEAEPEPDDEEDTVAVAEEIVIDEEDEPLPPTFNPPADNEESLRLDERLQRHLSKDLRRAFSLNDRFRFRRELFGNSEAEMADALNVIEAMRDYDEAEDYFYGNLGWDRNNDEVKEFMAVVKNHFL